MTFDELQETYAKWLRLDDDPGLLRILYGAFLANQYEGIPVWILLLGAAGSGKTEMLMSFAKSEKVIMSSQMTPNALISGKGSENSLLCKLDKKILIIKDLSTITEQHSDDRNKLFSILRDAYDGYYRRDMGDGDPVEFKGKFGIIAAGTLAVEAGRKMESILGERFLYIRMKANREAILDTVLRNASKKDEMHEEIRHAAADFIDGWTPPASGRTLPGIVVTMAREAAKALVVARTSILRDPYSKEVAFPADVGESPTRAYEQMILLLSAMRYLGADRDELIVTVRRLLLDSIPYTRLRVLEVIASGVKDMTEITKQVKMARSYIGRIVDDLESLGILEKKGQSIKIASRAILDAMGKEML